MELCIDTLLMLCKKIAFVANVQAVLKVLFLDHYLNALHHLHYIITDFLFLVLTLVATLLKTASKTLEEKQ